ncbi:unnamed protein product [Fraxinus pennsylvanica]|uniref:Serine-threonine/tyrosine-protein kinase catalytic domain-containing protein n=1 Tax=Fraxinus pennsylvanica TaxID=56036 RepID=A0AAD2A4X4_9LAMI|nr:unnamed protein product [Fraxinus pennsylvanica]
MDNGDVVAFKKLWPATNRCSDEKSGVCDSFSAEVKTLGSIRHKNIVKFLGYRNKSTRSLMYDYMPNGSLGSLLHDRNGTLLEWELRYQILLGAAQGLIMGKTDVYSHGVVVMKVLTGKQPIDPTIPNGLHVVDWVRQIKGGLEVLDPSLLSRSESEIEEMM